MQYSGTIVKWRDGDTPFVRVPLYHTNELTFVLEGFVRVFGINCNEVEGPQKVVGLEEKAYAESLAPPGTAIRLTQPRHDDKFGRFLGIITLPDGQDFAGRMLAASKAKPWDGHGDKPV